jgi:hypothetical protein
VTNLELLAAIRRVVREELARARHSGGPSAQGIAAPGQGDDQCDEMESEFMDHTHTEHDSESSSLERMARDDVARLRRGMPLRPPPRPRRARRKESAR